MPGMRRSGAALLLAVVIGTAAAGCDGAAQVGGEAPTISVHPAPSTPPSTAASSGPSAGTTISPTGPEQTSEAPPSARGSSGSPTPTGVADPARPPSSYGDAVALLDAARGRGAAEHEQRLFRTPEDIYCVLTDPTLDPTCELPQQAGVQDADACGNAPSQRVGRIEIPARGATAVCNTDTIRESVPDTVAPLGVVSRGGVACVVADPGVTCVEAARGAAFFLGIGRYDVFAR